MLHTHIHIAQCPLCLRVPRRACFLLCREYLEGLVGYLESFHSRTQPLGSLNKIYAKLADFEERFEAGEVPGWSDKGVVSLDGAANSIDMTAFATVEEVETLGESTRLK